MRLLAAAALLCTALPAAAQEAPPLRIDLPEDATYGFVIDRRVSVRRGPGYTYEEPRERKIVSTLRVRPRATSQDANVLLDVHFLRVHGFESGDLPTDEVRFDRKADDPPTGRPETLIVGRTVTVEARRDGTLVAVRGVDEAMPGNRVAATAVIADLRALVAQLPPAGTSLDRGAWRTDTLEGRGLLRSRIAAEHAVESATEGEVTLTVEGDLTAAPEGAGESFARSFRVTRGERTARYRIARADGLPIDGRVTTAYAVEARLAGSDMEVGVDSETIVAVRRIAAPDDPNAGAATGPEAPKPGDRTPNRGLPGWIGTPRDVLVKIAGEPTRSGGGLAGGRFDTFGGLGLIYEYDDDGFVRQITATRLSGRESFGGRILGVAIGDSLADAIALWGEPTSREKKAFDSLHDVQWVFDTLLIELEAWVNDGSDPAFGAYRADQVKRIRVSNRAVR